jgi:hypothetical protein
LAATALSSLVSARVSAQHGTCVELSPSPKAADGWKLPRDNYDNGFQTFTLTADKYIKLGYTVKDYPFYGLAFIARATSIQGTFDYGYHLELTKDENHFPPQLTFEYVLDYNFVFTLHRKDGSRIRSFYLSHHDSCDFNNNVSVDELRSVEFVTVYQY